MSSSAAYDPALLPPADEAVRCAVHAEAVGLDPGGTALWADELVVVDVPLPWPKPVWAAVGFTAVPEWVMLAGEAGRQVRVLAAVGLGDGIARIVTHDRHGGASMRRREHHVEPSEVAGLLSMLLTAGLDASPGTVVDVAAPLREVLVCAQGSHDVCCGSRGTALALELEVSRPEVWVRRVSHTGGHRMAPTAMTLPDGRMWGMVDGSEMAAIVDRSRPPSQLASRCRGWTGAAPGPSQVAERAVFAHLDDWRVDDERRRTSIVGDHGDVVEVRVDTERGSWAVTVRAGRAVPTIACGQPGGLPAKPGREWVADAVRRWRG